MYPVRLLSSQRCRISNLGLGMQLVLRTEISDLNTGSHIAITHGLFFIFKGLHSELRLKSICVHGMKGRLH